MPSGCQKAGPAQQTLRLSWWPRALVLKHIRLLAAMAMPSPFAANSVTVASYDNEDSTLVRMGRIGQSPCGQPSALRMLVLAPDGARAPCDAQSRECSGLAGRADPRGPAARETRTVPRTALVLARHPRCAYARRLASKRSRSMQCAGQSSEPLARARWHDARSVKGFEWVARARSQPAWRPQRRTGRPFGCAWRSSGTRAA